MLKTAKLIIIFFLISSYLPCRVSAESPGGRTICDQVGRSVAAPLDPRRVIALAPSITELIYALGEQQRLAGVAQQSDYPPDAKSLPTVGSFIHPDIEKIVSLRPDLCLALKEGNPRDVIARLEAEGIVVYVLSTQDLEGIMRSLLATGELLGAGQKAKDVVDGMHSRIDHVKALTAGTTVRPKVFFQLNTNPMVSAGRGTFVDELIDYAGGANVSRDLGVYPRLTKEQVLASGPDVIIITSMTKGENFEHVKSEWDQWPGLPAVVKGRVYVVDSNLFDRPSIRLVDALEILVRLIHPELFSTGKIPG